MELGLQGRTAIVCGASSGLGLASAEALAEEGAHVAMLARRAELLEREAERIGALAIRTDVTEPRDLGNAVERTLATYGSIDILVWNGGGPPPGRAENATVEDVQHAVELLLLPPVLLVHLCLPHLRKSGSGRIVAITSMAVKEPVAHLALSNAVRPGLTGWAKTLSREVGRDGITVNCVAPGQIATARLDELYPDGPSKEQLRNIPLGRWGLPREFGDVVCFLASDRARYVSGTTIPVDGGLGHGLL